MSSNIKFNLIVAMCNNRGIGYNGKLPWPILRKDMAFLAKVSTETKDQNKRNAVVMGRKTWLSIPEKRRPLKDRINIIISTTIKNLTDPNTYVVNSFEDSIKLIKKKQSEIEGIYVFGGSSVYEKALNSNYACRVYLTKVYADFECDTFLPEFESSKDFIYHQLENTSFNTGVQTDNNIEHQLFIYEKNTSYFSPIVAFLDKTRGFAKSGKLPWPYLEKDYKFYTSLIGSVQESGYKNVVIKGRVTYESAKEEGKKANVHTIVISSKLKYIYIYVYYIKIKFK
ncbi:DgyrCDS1443 [Dimorphilus gyrociliatus]|uniref:dihydrofolate reductase n=1 Tax=Dimorphilus gyrociliatus TaxID=2664684 RepID=A0A7I8V7I6_9ANNE|nr:DgyrCDS1443 [Dimorphilus gyrociliatus]